MGVSPTQQPGEGRANAPYIPGPTFDLQPEVKTEPLRQCLNPQPVMLCSASLEC